MVSDQTVLIGLTAVLLVRGAVVVAVVDAVADVVLGDAAAVVAGELAVGIAGPEEAAHLVAAVAAVVVVVAAIVVGNAAAVPTGEHGGLACVEGCESQTHTRQSSGQWEGRTGAGELAHRVDVGFT